MHGPLEGPRAPARYPDRSRSPGLGRPKARTADVHPAEPSQSWIVPKGHGRRPSGADLARGQVATPGQGRPKSRSGDRRNGSARRRSAERRRAPAVHGGDLRMTKSTSAWMGWQVPEDTAGGGMAGRAECRPRTVRSRKAAGGTDGGIRVRGAPQDVESDETSPGRHIHDSVGSIVQKGAASARGAGAYSSDEYASPKLAAHPRGGSFYNPEGRERGGWRRHREAGGSGDSNLGFESDGRAGEHGYSDRGFESDGRARDREHCASADRGFESDGHELNFNPGRVRTGSPDVFCHGHGRRATRSPGRVGKSPEQDGSDWGWDSRSSSPDSGRSPLGRMGEGFNTAKGARDSARGGRGEGRRSLGDVPPVDGGRSPSPFDVMRTAPEMGAGSGLMGSQEALRTNDLMRTAELRWDFLQSTDVCWDLNSRDAERMNPGTQGRWTDSGRPGVKHRSPSTGAQPVTPHGLPRMPRQDSRTKAKAKGGFIAKMLSGCCRPEGVMYDAPDGAQVPQQRRTSFFAQRRCPTEREATSQRFANRQKFMVNLIEEGRFNPNSGRQQ